jgi:hypothetical protein
VRDSLTCCPQIQPFDTGRFCVALHPLEGRRNGGNLHNMFYICLSSGVSILGRETQQASATKGDYPAVTLLSHCRCYTATALRFMFCPSRHALLQLPIWEPPAASAARIGHMAAPAIKSCWCTQELQHVSWSPSTRPLGINSHIGDMSFAAIIMVLLGQYCQAGL